MKMQLFTDKTFHHNLLKSTIYLLIHFAGPDVYFSGGYITQRHGGKEGIDGIQVEIPRDLRIDGGEEGRKRVGHALGKVDFVKD
jgi:hypothetical protein